MNWVLCANRSLANRAAFRFRSVVRGATDLVPAAFHDGLDAIVQERTAELERTKAHLERSNQRLEVLATHDGLTGLPNRRAFSERLARKWRRAIRNRVWFSVILADIDCFKA